MFVLRILVFRPDLLQSTVFTLTAEPQTYILYIPRSSPSLQLLLQRETTRQHNEAGKNVFTDISGVMWGFFPSELTQGDTWSWQSHILHKRSSEGFLDEKIDATHVSPLDIKLQPAAS